METRSVPTGPASRPPSASGTFSASRPREPNSFQSSREKPACELRIRCRRSKLYWAVRRRRVLSSSICCSSVKEKSTRGLLESQDHLGNDVLLDLVGSTENTELAAVEIVRGQPGGVLRPGQLRLGSGDG